MKGQQTMPTMLTVGLLLASGMLVSKYNGVKNKILAQNDAIDSLQIELKQTKDNLNKKTREASNQAADLTRVNKDIEIIRMKMQEASIKAAEVDVINEQLLASEAKAVEAQEQIKLLTKEQQDIGTIRSELEQTKKSIENTNTEIINEKAKSDQLIVEIKTAEDELQAARVQLAQLKVAQ